MPKTLEQRFDESISGAVVASFDMFDTLVHRTVHSKAIERSVCLRAAEATGLTIGRTAELRDVAWEIVTASSIEAGKDPEARFEDWMSRWAWLMSLEPAAVVADFEALARDLVECELRLEAAALNINDDAVAMVERAKSRGLKVVLTSDMYLEKHHIERLLEAVRMPVTFDHVFVSSEYSLTKRSGRLFRQICSELHLGEGDLSHIGDNRSSDVDGARHSGCGVRAVHYDRKHRVRRQREKEFVWNQFVSTGEAGELLRIASEDFRPEARQGFMAYGHDVYGPVLAPFIKRIAEIAEERNVDRIYFLAREGFLLKMLYDAYVSSVERRRPTVPSDYLCVSRLTTLRATAGLYGLREAALGTVDAMTSVKKALGRVVNDDILLARIAARYGFSELDELFDQFSHPMFHLLVRDAELNARIDTQKSEFRELLGKYLDTIGFDDAKSVLVVDVGWAGQIQESLALFCQETGRPQIIHGAYLATNNVAEHRRRGGMAIIPALADRNVHDYFANSVFRNVDLYETICRAPHGSVVGYANGLPVEAEGEKREVEARDDAMLSKMQKGVALYAAAYFRMAEALAVSAVQTFDTARASLTRLHRFPTPSEVRVHLDVGHVASHWTGDAVEASVRPSFRAAFRHAHWKEAFLRAAYGLAPYAAFVCLSAVRRERVVAVASNPEPIPVRSGWADVPAQPPTQDIEHKAMQAFTDNWLRSDVDDKGIDWEVPNLKHAVVCAALARIHAFRNHYSLRVPASMKVRYWIKKELSISAPKLKTGLLKCRSLASRISSLKGGR
jgi:FMN phosphatase YigB (HAD superfamily)